MLWKKLVQFGKRFDKKKKKSTSTDISLVTAIHGVEITLGRGVQCARAAVAVRTVNSSILKTVNSFT
jgi:hypothetical protein